MTVKQVQRYIKLNDLAPDLMKMVDEKKIAFTPAVEMAFIKPKNQRYIAVAIEGQQSAPSLSQAQRMRELDQKGILNPDVIDGIMLEEKKEADKVILDCPSGTRSAYRHHVLPTERNIISGFRLVRGMQE